MEKKAHIEFIDLAKGFCIMLVVLYHIMGHFSINDNIITIGLQSFRIPLYFILSGLFFKPYESFAGFVIRKTNKLVVPFIAFYVLTVILLPLMLSLIGVELKSSNNPLGWHYFSDIYYESWPMNSAIWFLLCLFVVNILFYVFYLLNKKFRKGLLSVLCLVIGIAGYYFSSQKVKLPLFIDTAMTALPFFYFGYAIKNYTGFLNLSKAKWQNLLLFCACIVFCCIFSEPVNFITNTYYRTNIVSFYLCGMVGTMGILFLSKALNRVPLVNTFGRYSIIILVTHYPILGFLFVIFDRFDLVAAVEIIVVFIVLMVMMLFIIPFFRKYGSYITAQKDIFKV